MDDLDEAYHVGRSGRASREGRRRDSRDRVSPHDEHGGARRSREGRRDSRDHLVSRDDERRGSRGHLGSSSQERGGTRRSREDGRRDSRDHLGLRKDGRRDSRDQHPGLLSQERGGVSKSREGRESSEAPGARTAARVSRDELALPAGGVVKDELYARFLVSEAGNAAKATARHESTLEWRREQRVDQALQLVSA